MSLTISQKCKAVVVRFEGKPNNDYIQRKVMQLIYYLENQHLQRIIVDTRGLQVMFTLSLQWFRKICYPRALKAHVQYVALVIPKDFLSISKLEKMVAKNKGPVRFAFFHSIEEGEQWMINQAEMV